MIKRALVLIVLVASTATRAQAPESSPLRPPPSRKLPPPQPSAYCVAVSAGFLESEAKASEAMQNCVRGDTVVIPAQNAGAVARMCDFTKAMVMLGDKVVCAMVFPERSSK